MIRPFPHDVDLAPQLVTISLVQAALAAIPLALGSAHPVLAITWPDVPIPDLSDPEHHGALVLHVSDQLARILDAYAAAVIHDHSADDPDSFPF